MRLAEKQKFVRSKKRSRNETIGSLRRTSFNGRSRDRRIRFPHHSIGERQSPPNGHQMPKLVSWHVDTGSRELVAAHNPNHIRDRVGLNTTLRSPAVTHSQEREPQFDTARSIDEMPQSRLQRANANLICSGPKLARMPRDSMRSFCVVPVPWALM